MPDSIPRPIVWSTQLLSGYTRRELTGRQRAIFNILTVNGHHRKGQSRMAYPPSPLWTAMLTYKVDAGFACSSISIQAGQVFAVKVGYSHPARLDALIKILNR
jgi:hypothetical protein